MDFEWTNYQRGHRKILKTADNFLYSKGSKGRPGSNTQYMRCASSSCPGSGKFKIDQEGSFEILKRHNHDERIYAFEAKALEVLLRKEAGRKDSTSSTRQVFNNLTRNHPAGTDVNFSQLESGNFISFLLQG